MTLLHQENILVIPRSIVFENIPAWHGVNHEYINSIVAKIEQHKMYMPRYQAETDYNFKQIIPYLIFRYNNHYFVMERKANASEQRLANKISLGIGGHLRQEDLQGQSIFDWALREFQEEVSYDGNLSITTLGVLNDDSNDVGKVHLGLVLLLEGNCSDISIKDEHKTGNLQPLTACLKQYESMESWSQLVLDYLQQT